MDIVYPDLSKAFDEVSHDILINKMVKYGLDDTTVQLLDRFITAPSIHQRIHINWKRTGSSTCEKDVCALIDHAMNMRQQCIAAAEKGESMF